MMRPGFSLLEIIIALAISSFVGIMIFNTISLLQRASSRYNQLITIDSQQQLLFSHMQKDISSMVLPLWGFAPNQKDKKEEQEKAQQDYIKRFGLQIEVENERLKSLSFVTTSVLRTYGPPKTRLARVRYILLPDAKHEGFFTLMRQESPELAMQDFERTHTAYAIAFGIKACTIACTSIIESDQDNKRKIEEVSSWTFAESLKQQPQAQQGMRVEQPIALPQIITLAGTMGDLTSEHEHPFSYVFSIPIDPRIKSQIPEKQETTKQPAAPGQKAGAAPISPESSKKLFDMVERSPVTQKLGNALAGGKK